MDVEMRRILAQVLYFEREKVAEADAAFDAEVARFFDRMDARSAGDGKETL